MQTPWGDISVSDAHVHFFSLPFFASLANQSGKSVEEVGRALNWRIPAFPEDLATEWRNELNRCGVSRAALIASIPGDEDSVAAAVSAYPERFHGYFMANPMESGGIGRIRATLQRPRFQGVCLFPAMHHYSIADACLRPVFEAAAERPGSIVFVHCGVLTVGVRRKLGLPSRFDMRYSNPIDLHPVALDFPQVNFVIPHFGAGYFREALMLCDLCPNVHLDTSSSNSWIKYQAETLQLRDVFRRALDVAGPHRLLFGSDSSFFPRGWHAAILEAQIQVLQELAVTPEQARQILGGNLERLLAGPKPD
jgi:predicted TIM-barrel fold metal-dependent hydrolase